MDSLTSIITSIKINCPSINTISLSSCPFYDSVQPLSLIKSFNNNDLGLINLKRLDLSSSFDGDQNVELLAESDYFKQLEFLKLRNCSISNSGAKSLFESKGLKSLKILILSKNKISQVEGPYQDLKKVESPLVKREIMNLKLLDLRENDIRSFLFMKGAKNFLKYTIVLA